MPWPFCNFGDHQVKKGRVRTVECGLKAKIRAICGVDVDEGETICDDHKRSLYEKHGVRQSAAGPQAFPLSHRSAAGARSIARGSVWGPVALCSRHSSTDCPTGCEAYAGDPVNQGGATAFPASGATVAEAEGAGDARGGRCRAERGQTNAIGTQR